MGPKIDDWSGLLAAAQRLLKLRHPEKESRGACERVLDNHHILDMWLDTRKVNTSVAPCCGSYHDFVDVSDEATVAATSGDLPKRPKYHYQFQGSPGVLQTKASRACNLADVGG